MIRFGYKSFKIIFLLILSLFLYSCKPGCTEPHEFDSETVILESFPEDDGVYGKYDKETGGQVANNTQTGLRINGEPMVIRITGSWSPWQQIDSETALKKAEICKLCFKKIGVDNCLCADGETPQPEPRTMMLIENDTSTIDCSGNDQEDPNKCTCTKRHGLASDLNTYIISTDYQRKDESILEPDEQKACRFTAGVGAYLGLFGRDGVTFPLRSYHLYTEEKGCDVPLDSNGKCLDSKGNDITYYTYRTPNGRTFVRDDKSGNNGSDQDRTDDEYHEAGEVVKLIINDRFYADNFGEYQITFLGGVLRDKDGGILEYIVGSVEDFIIGKEKSDGSGTREGGALKFLYESLVKDSTFITVVQMALILYVTFFGINVLMGTVETSQKEILNRIVKLSLVLFFTTSTSWFWYDKLVVGFFKYGMDGVIAMFTGLIDTNISESSLIKVAQSDRVSDTSQATRFSYIDYVIYKLISPPIHRKIWGIVLGNPFGFLFFIPIYLLIAYFIYVVSIAALIYITSLLQLVLALALGPIFILASLFSRVESAFKQWISFMANRGLEVIMLFLVLYTFLILIDERFNDLLWFRVCREKLNLGLFSLYILRIDPDSAGATRGFIDWITMILGLAALMFLLKIIINKIPSVANDLVSISGQGSGATDLTSIANSLAGSYWNAVSSGVKKGLPRLAANANALRRGIARETGASKAWDKMTSKLPRGPVSIARDRVIDKEISKFQKQASDRGLSGAKANEFVRANVMKSLNDQSTGDYNYSTDNTSKFRFLGVDATNIEKRLNSKLVDEPLKNFIKNRAKRLRKTTDLYGKDLRERLRKDAESWANKNLAVGVTGARFDGAKMKDLFANQSRLTANEAAKKFSGNASAQNAYLDHLKKMSADSKRYGKGSESSSFTGYFKRKMPFTRTVYNPKKAQERFLQKVDKIQGKQSRKDYYKNLEAQKLQQSGKDKNYLAKIVGWNTAKSMRQRFKFFDETEDVKKTTLKKRFHDKRNDYKRDGKQTLEKILAKEIRNINDNYVKQLEKYGYKPDKNGKVAKFQADAPSKMELRKEARRQIQNISKRITVLEVRKGQTGMEYITQNADKLHKDSKKKFEEGLKNYKEKKKKDRKDRSKTSNIEDTILKLTPDFFLNYHYEQTYKGHERRLYNQGESTSEAIDEMRKIDLAASKSEKELMDKYLLEAVDQLQDGTVERGEGDIADRLDGINEVVDDLQARGARLDKSPSIPEEVDKLAADSGEKQFVDDAVDDEKGKSSEVVFSVKGDGSSDQSDQGLRVDGDQKEMVERENGVKRVKGESPSIPEEVDKLAADSGEKQFVDDAVDDEKGKSSEMVFSVKGESPSIPEEVDKLAADSGEKQFVDDAVDDEKGKSSEVVFSVKGDGSSDQSDQGLRVDGDQKEMVERENGVKRVKGESPSIPEEVDKLAADSGEKQFVDDAVDDEKGKSSEMVFSVKGEGSSNQSDNLGKYHSANLNPDEKRKDYNDLKDLVTSSKNNQKKNKKNKKNKKSSLRKDMEDMVTPSEQTIGNMMYSGITEGIKALFNFFK